MALGDDVRRKAVEDFSGALGALLGIGVSDLPSWKRELLGEHLGRGYRIELSVVIEPLFVVCYLVAPDLIGRQEIFRVETFSEADGQQRH